jgi:hypothetical protein
MSDVVMDIGLLRYVNVRYKHNPKVIFNVRCVCCKKGFRPLNKLQNRLRVCDRCVYIFNTYDNLKSFSYSYRNKDKKD